MHRRDPRAETTVFRLAVLLPVIAPVIWIHLELPRSAAAEPTRKQAVEAIHHAVQFFRTRCSADGGYVYRLSADLKKREGEGKVGPHTAWVEPPGTPAVGMAYLEAYKLTNSPMLLEAAVETATALLQGQLVSGGWMSHIDFDPAERKKFAYRTDDPEVHGRRNWTTFDDDKSQSALRFLMQLDQALEIKNPELHEAIAFALNACLESQYPNGAWPQQYSEPHDPDEFPVLPASFPETWSREFPGKSYTSFYTLNDNTISDLINTLLLAWDLYGDERYLTAALRGGDFLVLAQLPEPQPGWAQQYDRAMRPAWARKFEPPAVTGGESQGAMQTLLAIYERTGEKKYVQPIPRALEYYRSSLLPDGRLARFYELGTNRPLYFTRDYRLTYDDGDVPTHYGFKSTSRLDRIAKEYARLMDASSFELRIPHRDHTPKRTTRLIRQTESIIAALDDRGAWVEEGRLRYYGEEDGTRRIIESATFCRNLLVLASYAATLDGDRD